jgi:hypothetical protein
MGFQVYGGKWDVGLALESIDTRHHDVNALHNQPDVSESSRNPGHEWLCC